MLPAEEIKPESSRTLSKFKQESVNLTEWSTTERIAKIQEINHSQVIILIKNAEKQKEIRISPRGIEPPLRNVRDGVVYFGCKRRDLQGTTVVDYVCKIKSKVPDSYRGPHFMIYFDLAENAYFLHDLEIGFGTFFKVSDMLILASIG